ncbi:MAG: MFS transporter [Streptosporangiales bacterium]
MKRGSTWAAVASVVFLSLNLRASIAALGPVLPQVRDDLGLGRAAAGLFTTVPVLCFGVLAPLAGWMATRWGAERALVAGVLGLAVGVAVRSYGSVAAAFAGTVLLGAGITVANVVVPIVVKRDFAAIGPVTGAYSASLTGGAAIAAAVSAPLAFAAGLGWQVSLLLWSAPALGAAAVWTFRRRSRPSTARVGAVLPEPAGRVWRSGTAWALAGFMATQSLLFYAANAWLPVILQAQGVSPSHAGYTLSAFNIVGIASALVAPSIASRTRDQRWLALCICGGWAVGVLGLLFVPALYPLWALLAGFAQGAAIALAVTLIVLRSARQGVVHNLSGMVQGVGYALAALGPLLLGVLRDATGSWAAPLWFLVGVVVVMSGVSIVVGRPKTIG